MIAMLLWLAARALSRRRRLNTIRLAGLITDDHTVGECCKGVSGTPCTPGGDRGGVEECCAYTFADGKQICDRVGCGAPRACLWQHLLSRRLSRARVGAPSFLRHRPMSMQEGLNTNKCCTTQGQPCAAGDTCCGTNTCRAPSYGDAREGTFCLPPCKSSGACSSDRGCCAGTRCLGGQCKPCPSVGDECKGDHDCCEDCDLKCEECVAPLAQHAHAR